MVRMSQTPVPRHLGAIPKHKLAETLSKVSLD